MKNWISGVLVILVLSVFCLGQAETGVVTGTVLDPTGAVVQGATVTATNLATQAKRTATTNAEGLYTLAALPPGQYQVDVTATTFAPYKEALTVTVGSRNVMSPKLQLTTTATTVEVIAGGGAVQVETQTSDISTVVSSQQVASLP